MAPVFGLATARRVWLWGGVFGLLVLGGCGSGDGSGLGRAWLGDPRVEANGAVYRTYFQRDGEAEVEMGLVATTFSPTGDSMQVNDPCGLWDGNWRSIGDIVLGDPAEEFVDVLPSFSGHLAADGRSLSGRWRVGTAEATADQGAWRWTKISDSPSLGSYGTVEITTSSGSTGILETVYAHRSRQAGQPDRLEVCVGGVGLGTSALDLLSAEGSYAVPAPFSVDLIVFGLLGASATGNSVTVTTPLGPQTLAAVFDLVFPLSTGDDAATWDVNLTKIDDPSAP